VHAIHFACKRHAIHFIAYLLYSTVIFLYSLSVAAKNACFVDKACLKNVLVNAKIIKNYVLPRLSITGIPCSVNRSDSANNKYNQVINL